MSEFDDQEYAKCPICKGTGFDKPGHLCSCIVYAHEPITPDNIFDMLGIKDPWGKTEKPKTLKK
jgi:hypothetical protein